MLMATAARLAAIEALRPTAGASGGIWPTLAESRVFDSRYAKIDDLDEQASYTPVIAVFTEASDVAARAPNGDYDDTEVRTLLQFVAELGVKAREDDEDFVDALAFTPENGPEASIKLSALVAQIRYALEAAPGGALFRSVVKNIEKIESRLYAVPEFGLRFHRVTVSMTCAIPDDTFDPETGGLPPAFEAFRLKMPANSYPRQALDALAALVQPVALDPLAAVSLTDAAYPDSDPGAIANTDH